MNPMMRVVIVLLATVFSGLARQASAQTGLEFWLSLKADTVAIDSGAVETTVSPDLGMALGIKSNEPLVVTVYCAAPLDCKTIRLKLATGGQAQGVDATTTTPGDRESRWTFPADAFAGKATPLLQFFRGASTTTFDEIALTEASGVQPPRSTNPPGTEKTVAALATYNCTAELGGMRTTIGETYFSDDNLARFLIDARGNVYSRPDVDLIDENDLVEVWIIAHPDLLSAVKIRRTTAFRTPGAMSIVGQGVAVPSLDVRKGAPANQAAPRSCDRHILTLGDFQPGRAEIGVSVVTDKGDVTTGSFEFGVNTLYIGAFALGAIRTRVADPKFGLTFNGTDSVITRTEDREPRVLYTLTYTPFIWGKRDLEKADRFWNRRHLNPIFGLVISDVSNNFVVGAAYDFASAVYISAGLHLGRVRQLNPEADVGLGDVFNRPSTEIPTTKDWKKDSFIGVSLDLRAAAEFIKKVIPTT
jgi:hypothetical protein